MEQILDRLLLASLSDAHDPFAIERNEVQSILYFGDGGLFSDDIKLYHRTVSGKGTLTDDELNDGVEFLRESLRAGRRVLAVGATGATIVTAFLMESGFSSREALRIVTAGEAPKPDVARVRQHEALLEQRAAVSLRSFRDSLASIA